jgi:diaminopimelate epimerase
MRLAFTKMHGLGNDFIVFDAVGSGVPGRDQIRALADRRTGIGFDQALMLEPPRRPGTHVYYRIFNADGVEVEQCGNGARCIARLVATRRARGERHLRLDSPGGLVDAVIENDGRVSVSMGVPNFDPRSLPMIAEREAAVYRIDLAGTVVEFGAVSIGNPHAVVRVADVAHAPVDSIGRAMEKHELFPQRVNTGFLEIVTPAHVRLRVHERGVGETLACGTGACAAVVVARRHGPLEPTVQVDVPGGRLTVRWPGPGEPVWLTGPAATAFTGEVEIEDPDHQWAEVHA